MNNRKNTIERLKSELDHQRGVSKFLFFALLFVGSSFVFWLMW